jgi:hypothetical protein
LDRWADAVEKSKVLEKISEFAKYGACEKAYDLPVPSLIDSRQVFGCFLNEREHDQAEELIRDTSLYYIFNTLNQEHSK